MNEDKDYEVIRKHLSAYNEPGNVPAEEMWHVVGESWKRQAVQLRRAKTIRQWCLVGVGIAAVLTLGVMIGRSTIGVDEPAPIASVEPVVEPTSDDTPATSTSSPFRVAAARHFRDAETLLVLFDASDNGGDELSKYAEELLATTRLLMDSRASSDTEVKRLLQDLELLLIQISRLPEEADTTERQIIEEGLEGNSVLPRLRRLIPQGNIAPGA